MTSGRRARTATRRTRVRRLRVVGLVAVLVAIAAALVARAPTSSSSTAASPIHGSRRASPPRSSPRPVSPSWTFGRSEYRRALGEADGAVPAGTTIFDDGIPGVVNLDPALLGALRRAATAAAGDGVVLLVDSGWRSPAYQEHLLREAVAKHGSEEEAARWVATADTSAHVSGDAVDIGSEVATEWLAAHGAAYGLCRIYGNEPWHYELRPDAVAHGCPAVYADPTHDPRMRR